MKNEQIYDVLREVIKNNVGKDKKIKTYLELANLAGVHQGNLSKFINKERNLKYDTAYNILKTLENTYGITIKDTAIASIHRMGEYAPEEKIKESDDLVKIDIYQVTGAGTPFDLRNNAPITSIFINQLYARKADIAFLVDGESMYPTIKNNSIVGVSFNAEYQPNEVYAINHPMGGVTIKRISMRGNNWIIRSDNPDKNKYPEDDQYTEEEYPNLIIGRVVWVYQNM